MSISQPSRVTFWRLVLFLTAALPCLAIWQLLGLAEELEVVVLASKSWMSLVVVLAVTGTLALLTLVFTWSHVCEQVLAVLEAPGQLRRAAVVFLPLSLVAYTFIFIIPGVRDLLGQLGWVRFLVFWLFSLVGMYALKAYKNGLNWFPSLVLVVFFQGVVHLLFSQASGVTSYPFSMGWSETSRYYYPALFLSEKIFGTRLPWPILHPSLHLLLVPPYLLDAPLWFHRVWQVAIRLALLSLTALALLRRLGLKDRALRWLAGIWMLLYLFQGPVYYHLTVPLILVLWGFSVQRDGRTWLAIILASMWCGLSRINWHPMPGLLATVLYLLEVPYQGRQPWRYLLKPALWFSVGLAIALASQRAYIALSGIPDADFFYTSLSSNLLWYRLFPNASYQYGVLPATLIASLPMWAAMLAVLRQQRGQAHPLRTGLIVSALLVLLAGGLVVSMKIGGGVDIHNLDAYLSLLLFVTAYLLFARYTPDTGKPASPLKLPWSLLALLVAVPAWFTSQGGVSIKTYEAARTQSVLARIQARVDETNARGGEILFITQRHLVSMHMLTGVRMIPEYEREELMEMAMGNNQDYLEVFREDIANQRFGLILVDPLNYRLLGKNYPFGEENNAWAQRVMKPILCHYQQGEIFTEDQIAIYVPQQGARQCP